MDRFTPANQAPKLPRAAAIDPLTRLPSCVAVRGRARPSTGNAAGAGAIATTALALLVMALGMAGLQAAGSGEVQTVEELRAAMRQNKLVPLAFLKGDEVRLYFTNAEQRLMFKGKWEHARLPVRGFRSHLVELRFDASPPAMPEPQEQWREPKILAYDDWQRLARSAAETLVRAQPGHGLYVRYALGKRCCFGTQPANSGRYPLPTLLQGSPLTAASAGPRPPV